MDSEQAISQDLDRSPFDAGPLTADQYHELLSEKETFVLRVSDGETRHGTFRFWVEGNQLYWRALSWTSPRKATITDLSAVLDDDHWTQLLTEESE